MNTGEKKQKISPGRCQKCDDLGYGVKLFGGYNGTFCDNHLNEWHEIVVDKPEFEDYVVKRVSQDSLVHGGIANEYSRTLAKEILDLQDELYYLGKLWAETGEDTETQDGLYHKYNVSKTSGEPIDPKAFYFPLRLDKDPHARTAARKYANSINIDNHILARDLHSLLDGIELDLANRSEHD